MEVRLELNATMATIAGFVKPSIHCNDTKGCAVLNSMSYSLERHDNDYYYRGENVDVASSWDRESGVLSITIYSK